MINFIVFARKIFSQKPKILDFCLCFSHGHNIMKFLCAFPVLFIAKKKEKRKLTKFSTLLFTIWKVVWNRLRNEAILSFSE